MHDYRKSIAQLFSDLQANERGLSSAEANARLAKHGRNELKEADTQFHGLRIFLSQWKSPLIIILLVAAGISAFFHEFLDTIVILVTVGINVLIGFTQEYKADRALEKLKHIITYQAVVLRDGQKIQIDSTQLVPGDMLYLEAGDKVQADGRILQSKELSIDEAVLTGESEPQQKNQNDIENETPLGDRSNMVYRGTTVVNGSATILITATAIETELGRIASLISGTKQDQTPLQKQLSKLSRQLAYLVLTISASLFLLGTFVHAGEYKPVELLETAIAVAVAAIPEGLVIALTVILAVGMQFILKRKALVRKLVAAETLGSVSVICTDKTGTITEGRMRVTRILTKKTTVTTDELSGEISESLKDIRLAVTAATLCNDAIQTKKHGESDIKYIGNMTDRALARLADSVQMKKPSLDHVYPRRDVVTFNSKRKFMATLNVFGNERRLFVKGAPEIVLDKCSHILENGKARKLTKADEKWFLSEQKKLSSLGLRLIAVAYKDVSLEKLEEKDADGLVCIGMFAMKDPVRSDVRETLETAQRAGIRVTMITGDHADTAMAIAREVGLEVNESSVLSGPELRKLSKSELKQAINRVTVFARVAPEDKITIVQAYQAAGEIVAMTGDGVNDAPALKGADIGVALGSGTDVAKETADMVLLNNTFATIVAAVEEGRAIYQNVKKVVLYLIADSFTEVILIAGSIIGGLPLAILPAQILWINLVQDSLPAMALAFDRGDKENMEDPPRKKGTHIIDKEILAMIITKTIVSDTAMLALFVYHFFAYGDITLTRTLLFAVVGVDALFFIFPVRSFRKHLWEMNPLKNKFLTGSLALSIGLVFASVYWAPLQTLLRTVPLEPMHWLIVFGFGIFNIAIIETIKQIYLKKRIYA